jgi:adenylate cyclase
MKIAGRAYHKNLAALIVIFAVSGIVILCHLSGLLDYVEYKVYDFRINLFAKSNRRSDDIIMVLLDQDSIEWAQARKGWGWPWPRKAYADFVDYMKAGEAKSVVFDVIFSEPSVYRSSRQDEIIDAAVKSLELAGAAAEAGQPGAAVPLFTDAARSLRELGAGEDDASFVKAEKEYGRVVQGVFFSTTTGDALAWPPDLLDKPLFKPDNFGAFMSRFDISSDIPGGEGRVRAQFPIRELRNGAAVVGNITGKADSDNIVRRNRLFTYFDGKAVPGLAAAAVLAAGYDENISRDPAGKRIRWGDYTVPVDKEGKTLLRFRGDPLYAYPSYSVSQVLQSAEDYAAGREPLLPPENFRGSYVFFGYYAPGLFDIFYTPVSSVYPGMGVHITMLDNLLMGDFIQKAPDWAAALIVAGAVILVVVLALFSGRISVAIGGYIAVLAALTAAGLLTFRAGYWIPLAAPVIAVLLAYLAATLYSYATEGKDKRFIKHAFSSVLSPKVVDQLIADPSQLKLGGEKRKLTAVFTDIQRFSSISSELQDQYGENGPTALVNLLNLYLTEMSDIVLANGGTVDKYEGDAIIAFFGAPVWMEDHAAAACRSAIQMKKREHEIREKIMNPEGQFFVPMSKLIEGKVIRGERPLYTRLGINTGDMVVGFMGTLGKMDYTIMGNAVNLAARLEGVNKQYDTKGILISEYTRERIGDGFVVRPLSRVTVVGIPVPLRLYELLEMRDEASPGLLEAVKAWERALGAYEERKFSEAGKAFAEIRLGDPEDAAAELYRKRCEKFAASPPPAEWDGVDNLTEK